jgi:O-succinylbenzoate synthase
VKTPGGELPPRGRLRLDFNATLDAGEFARVAATLPRERIDFVEDPCPYDGPTWRRLREETGLRLALDRTMAIEGVDVLVVKPAVQAVVTLPADVVVTSYMDHPVGQLHAAAVAARIATNPRCGLVTHVLFEPDAFSEQLRLEGARLVPPPGDGIGFDDLLLGLVWTRLA